MGSQGVARRRTARRCDLFGIFEKSGKQINSSRMDAMSLQIRRIVTGHTADGRAKVEVDEIAKNVVSNRPGASSCVVWSTKGFPVDNDGFNDPTSASFKTTVDGGTVFRIVRY